MFVIGWWHNPLGAILILKISPGGAYIIRIAG